MLIEYVVGPSVPVNTLVLTSSTWYSISIPFLYFGKFLNVASQALYSPWPSWSAVPSKMICVLSSSLISNVTVAGLIPSWLSLSSHTFLALTSTVRSSDLLVLVIVNPFL